MKTIFTRTLMVALLATSISAFAKGGGGKPNDIDNASTVTQQDNSNQNVNSASTQDEQKIEQQKIDQQNQEWLHDLRGDYGG